MQFKKVVRQMENQQPKLIDLDKDKLEYHKTGVLWLKGDPVYIVDLVREGNLAYVVVYAADNLEKKNPRKLAIKQTIKDGERFSSATRLGALANAMFPAKKQEKWVEKPPLFVAPVIPKYVNTLTGKEESGFFEREPDKETTVAGERVLQRGKNTGVFIGLSSIVWEEGFKIPTKSLVDALIQHQQGDGFYDFTGGNNRPDNPLGRGYQGDDY